MTMCLLVHLQPQLLSTCLACHGSSVAANSFLFAKVFDCLLLPDTGQGLGMPWGTGQQGPCSHGGCSLLSACTDSPGRVGGWDRRTDHRYHRENRRQCVPQGNEMMRCDGGNCGVTALQGLGTGDDLSAESRLKDVVWGKVVLSGGSSKCKFLRQEALWVRQGLAAG